MQYLLLVAVAGTVLIADAGVLAVNEGVVVTVSAAAVVVVVVLRLTAARATVVGGAGTDNSSFL